jgi:hypothetical protein
MVPVREFFLTVAAFVCSLYAVNFCRAFWSSGACSGGFFNEKYSGKKVIFASFSQWHTKGLPFVPVQPLGEDGDYFLGGNLIGDYSKKGELITLTAFREEGGVSWVQHLSHYEGGGLREVAMMDERGQTKKKALFREGELAGMTSHPWWWQASEAGRVALLSLLDPDDRVTRLAWISFLTVLTTQYLLLAKW